jgi:hypothetical protein
VDEQSVAYGDAGGDRFLNILSGVVVSSDDPILGSFNAQAFVTVDGMGSTWTISGDLARSKVNAVSQWKNIPQAIKLDGVPTPSSVSMKWPSAGS